MQQLSELFSGDMLDASRIGVWGFYVIAAGVFLTVLAEPISRKFTRTKAQKAAKLHMKLLGLLLVAVGALGAIRII